MKPVVIIVIAVVVVLGVLIALWQGFSLLLFLAVIITVIIIATSADYFRFNKKETQRELEKEKIKEELKLKNRFSCDVCGTVVSENMCPNCNKTYDNQKKKGSSVGWYLLSILFGLFGGIIGYVALRQENPGAASNCLIIGIIITILSFIGALMMGFI
jgi:hypothetical protein